MASAQARVSRPVRRIPHALYFKVGPKGWSDSPLFVDLPWMDQMGYATLLSILVVVILSLVQNKGAEDEKGITIGSGLFKTTPLFNIGSFAIMIILAVLYAMFW